MQAGIVTSTSISINTLVSCSAHLHAFNMEVVSALREYISYGVTAALNVYHLAVILNNNF